MRPNGALRIFAYNWPIFVGTWSAALIGLFALNWVRAPFSWLILVAVGSSLSWSVLSLLVSTYIYDRSALTSGRWVKALLGDEVRTWASVHAGLDAEVQLSDVLSGRCLARLDIFDRQVMTSPSILRARALTAPSHSVTSCTPSALALEDRSCDALIIAFTAHEIRDRATREAFFGELRRVLRPGGRALLVEHLRDLPNFLAFGPGCLHFLGRAEWLRLAARAELAVASETRVTPFIMALALEKSPCC